MKRTITYNGVVLWAKIHEPEKIRRVLDAYVRGSQPVRISKRYKIPVSTIENWTKKSGVSRSRSKAAIIRVRKEQGIDVGTLKPRAEELYRSGLSTREIAAEIGVSYSTVYNWLRRRGVVRKTRINTLAELPEEKRAELRRRAIEMYRSGYDSGMISRLLPVKQQTVHGWIRKEGVVRERWQRHTVHSRGSVRGRKRRELTREVWRMKGEGRTQVEMAEELGVSISTVSGILTGRTDPFRYEDMA